MTRTVIDTGPLVALLNQRDRYHPWVRDVLETVEPPVFTCEAVLSETCFLLRKIDGGTEAVFELISRNIVKVDFRISGEVDSLKRLMKKFASVPMSLADACLVRMSELDSTSVILTLDGDFRVYRRHRRQTVPTIMPER